MEELVLATLVQIADQLTVWRCSRYHITWHNPHPTSFKKALTNTFQLMTVGRAAMPDSFDSIA